MEIKAVQGGLAIRIAYPASHLDKPWNPVRTCCSLSSMHIDFDRSSHSTRTDSIHHSTALREESARLSPSVQNLRHREHGSPQNTKHVGNTWPSHIKRLSLPSIRDPKETIDSWIDNVIISRPRSDPDWSKGRFPFSNAHKPEHMGAEPHPAQEVRSNSNAPSSKSERVKEAQESTHNQPDKRALKRARRTVAGLRDALFRRRLWLKERRNALHEERTSLAELEADLMTSIRRTFADGLLSESSLAQDHYTKLEQKVAALEAKRDELGDLQYEYDQAEIDNNLKETELDEEEQNFEGLLFDALGFSDSSNDDVSSASSASIHSAPPRERPQSIQSRTPPSPSLKLDRAQFLASRLRTKSDSALTTIRDLFPIARPRINWWILHTFGCSPIDYVQRARDKSMLQSLNDVSLDDENWARLVFDYWRQERELDGSPDNSVVSWAEVSTQDLPEPRHVRRLTVGGSYLLLSSELSKARYTVDNYDLLFPADSGFRQNFVLQADSISKDLDNLSRHREQSCSPMSAPAVLSSPVVQSTHP